MQNISYSDLLSYFPYSQPSSPSSFWPCLNNTILVLWLNSLLDDVQMKTALHYAAQEHRLDTVKVLVGIDHQHKEERTKKHLFHNTGCPKILAQSAVITIMHHRTRNMKYPVCDITESHNSLCIISFEAGCCQSIIGWPRILERRAMCSWCPNMV